MNYSSRDMIKSRGRDHQKHKQKYKKIVPPALIPGKSSERALESNWDRYKLEVNDSASQVSSGMDFSLLANAPISSGSHFQFKDDKNSISDLSDKTINTSNIFNLNVNLLSQSLSTLSFMERSEISENHFTTSEKIIMNRTAEDNKINYENYLRNFRQELNKINLISTDKSQINTEFVKKEGYKNEDNAKINLDSIEIEKHDFPSVQKNPEMKNNSDLEEWLNEILDE